MRIGGFQKLSLIDFEGKTCSVIFTQGCNFRCPYCQNPELVITETLSHEISFDEILSFLKRRVGLIDAVVFSGGEPLLQQDILEKAIMLKNLGFLIKIDTNGAFPDALEKVLEVADYVAMDIKASLERYAEITGVSIDINNITKSMDTIIRKARDYEFRTTVIKGFHDTEMFDRIGKLIEGARRYFIQRPRFIKVLDSNFALREQFSAEEIKNFVKTIERYVNFVGVR